MRFRSRTLIDVSLWTAIAGITPSTNVVGSVAVMCVGAAIAAWKDLSFDPVSASHAAAAWCVHSWCTCREPRRIHSLCRRVMPRCRCRTFTSS